MHNFFLFFSLFSIKKKKEKKSIVFDNIILTIFDLIYDVG